MRRKEPLLKTHRALLTKMIENYLYRDEWIDDIIVEKSSAVT